MRLQLLTARHACYDNFFKNRGKMVYWTGLLQSGEWKEETPNPRGGVSFSFLVNNEDHIKT